VLIQVTRINRVEKFWVNENLIEFMEETPDTILSMMSGRKVSVAETAADIVSLISNAQKSRIISRDEIGEVTE
jgi:flagellar protein FlbD